MKHTELKLNMLVKRRGPNGEIYNVAGNPLIAQVDGAPFLRGPNHYYVRVTYVHPDKGKMSDEWKVSRLIPHVDQPATDASDQQADPVVDSIV
jgi:hypothetical protein